MEELNSTVETEKRRRNCSAPEERSSPHYSSLMLESPVGLYKHVVTSSSNEAERLEEGTM